MRWRSAKLTWLELRWPREVQPDQQSAVIRLLASTAGTPLVLQASGSDGDVDHHLAVPRARATVVAEQLRVALPGLSTTPVPQPETPPLSRAVRMSLSSRRRPLTTDHPEALARALLTALAQVGRHEHLVLQWVLGPRLSARVVPSHVPGQHAQSWTLSLLAAPWAAPSPLDSEARTALRTKQGEPGWQAIGRLAVRASGVARQRQLLGQVLGSLRSAEAPGVRLVVRRERPARVAHAALPWRWSLVLNVQEVLALSSWPLGPTGELPVRRVSSRLVAVSRAIPRRGRVVGIGTWPGAQRPVAISASDSLRHLHVLGPTGVGKSTLLLNLIVQDMYAGRGVVVIEPKGDLIGDVLERVPEQRLDDVVLLDPTDKQPVGLNPLAAAGRSAELVADQLLAVFHGLYAAHWGPRTQDILHAGLLTLALSPPATLVGLPLLLTDPAFRRRVVGRIGDPIALGPFWAGFEAWSEAERTAAIAPVMNKLRPFLRPQLRGVIGQAQPGLDVRQVFTERKILLVNLAKGQLGPEAAALLGSLFVAALWQAILERSVVEPRRRHPVTVFIDEFQDYLHLPTDLSEALAAARGLGVGLHLAHQHLHQLEPGLRSAVLANARSRVCFQLGSEDARLLATGTNRLEAEDFRSLGQFEIYAALVAGGVVQPWCSARTDAPGRPTNQADAVRAASRQRYGTPRAQVEVEMQALLSHGRARQGDDLTPRRRSAGGSS